MYNPCHDNGNGCDKRQLGCHGIECIHYMDYRYKLDQQIEQRQIIADNNYQHKRHKESTIKRVYHGNYKRR